jgi:hypothetical protein
MAMNVSTAWTVSPIGIALGQAQAMRMGSCRLFAAADDTERNQTSLDSLGSPR